ncbi:MAG TPA: trypsin-like peptidase domain-containing protein, partial [Steroidobacteraceae bacterium]|nr:trypsin-like peptidase domain-containing protein [Steroidobacteraceae bacterium]
MSDRDLQEWNTDVHGETSAGPFLLRGEGEMSAASEVAVDSPREAQVADPQRTQLARPLPAKKPVSDSFAVPFRWIAKISIFKGNKFDSHGSGVLISDRHVLTAAHVLDDVIRSPGQFHLEVNLALDARDSLGPYRAAKAPDIAPKYDPANKDDVDNDFAIITLDRPVDRGTAKRLNGAPLCFWGSSSCAAGTTSVPVDPSTLLRQMAYTAGYPGNRGGNTMWCFSGMLASVPPQSPIMVYTGETTEGQSGSAVWIEQDGKRNLVGIAVARGNVNRVLRITWGVVEQLNEWMLRAEKPTPELELEQFETEQFEGESPGVFEVLPVNLSELEEHQVSPKNLVLLDHVHIPKAPDPAHPGAFITGVPTKLTVADLNPLFFAGSGTVILDSTPTGLQHCMDRLISSGFNELLGSKGQTGPGAGDHVHVALVDLTKGKLTAPEFAAWGAPVDMYGASVPKILALYAACQLRADLRNMIALKAPADGKQLESLAVAEWKAKGLTVPLPDLEWLFDIRNWAAVTTLDFAAGARAAFAHISDNCSAGTLIAKVSLPYIGSLAWQSGLLRPTSSGLWLKSAYCGKASWNSPVNTPFTHNATALSAATYFTLLAQGRLVDDASSTDIRNALKHGCVTSLFPPLPVVASKCGIYGGYIHDCAWIQDGDVRYVVAVLSKLSTPKQQQLYTQLIAQLDTLIRQNNQSPKAAC